MLQKKGIDVVLLDMQYFPRAEKVRDFARYLVAMRQIAEADKIPILQRFAIMKHLVTSAQYTARQLLAKDLFHPNDLTYGCLGHMLAEALQSEAARTEQREVRSRKPARQARRREPGRKLTTIPADSRQVTGAVGAAPDQAPPALSPPGVDALHQPAPGLGLAQACGLGDGDLEIVELRLDLLRRQHAEPRHQHRALEHRGLRAVEPFHGRWLAFVHEAAGKARALLILGHMLDGELPVRDRTLEHGARHLCRGLQSASLASR